MIFIVGGEGGEEVPGTDGDVVVVDGTEIGATVPGILGVGLVPFFFLFFNFSLRKFDLRF